MEGMRLLLIAAVVFGGALSFGSFGCATSLGSASGQERLVVAVDPPVQRASSETVEVTELTPQAAAQPDPPRRRLAQTVTLGQGTGEPLYGPIPQAQGTPGNGTNVTVNNNVTVVNGQPVYYGYGSYSGYGGYGYGGYESRRGGNVGARDGRGASSSPQAWAPNGWEGAQRTAAPGKTPNVGGNFPPAQSSGPAQMK